MQLILGSKYLLHSNELLGIIADVSYPLLIGRVEELLISCIGSKGEFVILFYGMYRLPRLFSSVPLNLNLPINIWKLLVTGCIVKIPHLGFILISIVEDVELNTHIDILHRKL